MVMEPAPGFENEPPVDQAQQIQQMEFDGGLDFSLLSEEELAILFNDYNDIARIRAILGIREDGGYSTFENEDQFLPCGTRESYAIIRGYWRQINWPNAEIDWVRLVELDMPGTRRTPDQVEERFNYMLTHENSKSVLMRLLFRVARRLRDLRSAAQQGQGQDDDSCCIILCPSMK